jgi:hypothetical protein
MSAGWKSDPFTSVTNLLQSARVAVAPDVTVGLPGPNIQSAPEQSG